MICLTLPKLGVMIELSIQSIELPIQLKAKIIRTLNSLNYIVIKVDDNEMITG